MEFKVEDVSTFLTWNQLGNPGNFGTTYSGHIPVNNSFGLEEMDVAIQVSHHRRAPDSTELDKQFQNEIKLGHIRHKNITRLIGFSSSADRFYLVYEMIHGRSLSDIMKDLSWEQMLKILKGISAGLSYLHSQDKGPFVLCNICADNIFVTEEFVPKIVNYKHCVVEGDVHTGGTVGYYFDKEKGNANRNDDVFAFGVLAIQLLTKSRSTTFKVGEGSSRHVKHILDIYIPKFKGGTDIAHSSYGRALETRSLTEMVIGCLKKDGRVNITTFRKDVVLLSIARQR